MRKTETVQLEIDSAFIEDVEIDPKFRDDIQVLLMGLQHLYTVPELRAQLFALLEEEANAGGIPGTERSGMDLWRILVLAVLKQGSNCDWDYLCELANQHQTLRQVMGHDSFAHKYERQTVIDNVSLLSPALLIMVNELLIEALQKLAS